MFSGRGTDHISTNGLIGASQIRSINQNRPADFEILYKLTVTAFCSNSFIMDLEDLCVSMRHLNRLQKLSKSLTRLTTLDGNTELLDDKLASLGLPAVEVRHTVMAFPQIARVS